MRTSTQGTAKRTRTAVGLLAITMLVSLISCRTVPTSTNIQPLRTAIPLTVLMETPRKIKQDYAYPDKTRQSFAWGRHGAEWRVLPADNTNAYAGFTLKNKQDVDRMREGTYLSFRMKPCVFDNHLYIGLVSGEPDANGVMTIKRLSEHRIREWGDWGLFAIRLATFPDMGPAVGKSAPTGRYPVDWTNIKGVRLIATPRGDWTEPLIIRDLQLGPARPDMF